MDAGDEPLKEYRPGTALVDLGRRERGGATAVLAPASTIDPIVIEFAYGPVTDKWIQIIDTTNGNRVITAIEVISPWNKMPGKLNEGYRKKLEDYERGQVSVVEIDLLRYPRRGRLVVKDDDIAAGRPRLHGRRPRQHRLREARGPTAGRPRRGLGAGGAQGGGEGVMLP